MLRDKVPFEVLEPGKSFEEHAAFDMSVPLEFSVKTTWKDDKGESHEKEQIVTF